MMWSFGDDDYGKLGLGGGGGTAVQKPQVRGRRKAVAERETGTFLLQVVETLLYMGIKKACCGSQFTVVLLRDGSVYTCGHSESFFLVFRLIFDRFFVLGQQIGLRKGDGLKTPRRLLGLEHSPVDDIAVGAEHTLALLKNGEVWAWGVNNHGQVKSEYKKTP